MINRRLKVLVVSNSLSGGGAERFTSTFLTHIDRSFYEPHLCLFRGPIDYDLPDDVPVQILEKRSPWHFLRTVTRLRRLIRRCNPDIILSSIAFANVTTGLALTGIRSRPAWIARVGNLPQTENRWLRTLAKTLYQRADSVISISQGLSDDIRSSIGIPDEKLTVIHNPVDINAVESAASDSSFEIVTPNCPVVMSLARFSPVKRLDLLVRAFRTLNEEVPAHLWLCGDGPLRRKIEGLVRELDLTDRVRFLGFQKNPYPFLKRASLFAFSSDHEGLGNALIEAQALGVPAVATACPHGPAEIVEHGVTGLLTTPGDTQQFADAMIKLLKEPMQRKRMSTAAKQRARSLFDCMKIVRLYEQKITSVLENGNYSIGNKNHKVLSHSPL